MIAHNTARPRWAANGCTPRVAPGSACVRLTEIAAAVAGARDLTRHLLSREGIEGVSHRQLKAWKELGGPLAEMALWVRSHPEHLEVVVAHLRGAVIPEPADLSDAVVAEEDADTAEQRAATLALLDGTVASRLEWARRLDVQAARSVELARRLREEASA